MLIAEDFNNLYMYFGICLASKSLEDRRDSIEITEFKYLRKAVFRMTWQMDNNHNIKMYHHIFSILYHLFSHYLLLLHLKKLKQKYYKYI